MDLFFLHNFTPDRVFISFNTIQIYWYGLFIVLGIIAGILINLKLASYYNISKNIILDLAFWLILTGIIGARIYDVFLMLPYYIEHPLDVFKIWNGGLAIHGGIFAGIIVIWIFAKKQKINFWLLTSIALPGLAIGQSIGRWGNYFNQELFGKPTELPWGIPINIINRPIEYLSSEFFHPTFLYESIGNFIIFLMLISLHIYIIKKYKQLPGCEIRNNVEVKKLYFLFFIFYFLFYSLLRFFLEFIRIDYTPVIFNLRFPQIISLFIIALITCIFLVKWIKCNYKII